MATPASEDVIKPTSLFPFQQKQLRALSPTASEEAATAPLRRISEPAGGWPSFLSPSFSFLGDFFPSRPCMYAAPGQFPSSNAFKGLGTR